MLPTTFKYRRVSIITSYKQNDYRCLSIRHIWIHSLSSLKRKNRSILKEISYEKVYRRGSWYDFWYQNKYVIGHRCNIVLLSCPLNYCDKLITNECFLWCALDMFILQKYVHIAKNIFTYTITYLDNLGYWMSF